jgi:hypothetical protein
MADLFGVAGRKLLDSLALPEPWQSNLSESLALVDDLTARVDALEVELRQLGGRSPLDAAPYDRARCRLGARLHDRL